MTRSGEFHWISKYLAPLAGPGSYGLKDDAALLTVPDGKSVVVTQDAIASGVHFLPDDPLDRVARKALRVNISDIVAKGATPHSYSLALGVPDHFQDDDMEAFVSGLAQDQEMYGIHLSGGDTYRSPDRLSIAVTMFALVDQSHYKARSGANPGDAVFVTGTIGDAALGLKVATGELECRQGDRDVLLDAYQLPEPPVAVAAVIAEFATASMDVSDGLIGDCRKLCAASKVGAVIDRAKIPLSDATRDLVGDNPELWTDICTGGDDYQVLCTISADDVDAFKSACSKAGVRATQIGEINSAHSDFVALDIDGELVSIDKDSYAHF